MVIIKFLKSKIKMNIIKSTLMIIICFNFIASATTEETYKEVYNNKALPKENGIFTFKEVQYTQVGSYISYKGKGTHEVNIACGISRRPQIFEVTILGNVLLLDNKTYDVIYETGSEIHASRRMVAMALSFVTLSIDRVHGTLIYTAVVSRGIMGTKTKVFVAELIKKSFIGPSQLKYKSED